MNKREKRQYKRIVIEGIDIQCKMHFATEVRLLNISFSGAAIRLNKRLIMGSKYRLHLEREDRAITLNSVVIWERMVTSQSTEEGEMIPIYEVGIRFEDVLSDKGIQLIKFIEKNFVQGESRPRLMGLRIDIVEPEKSVISDFPANYYVVKISQNGMHLETDQPMIVESKFNMELNLLEDKNSIKFVGRVATCLEVSTKSAKNYQVGVEFFEMSEKNRSKVKKFIDSVHKLNN